MHYLAAYAAFNVFQRKGNPALRCAVRQDQPVPEFIEAEIWEFGGTVTLEEPLPGFQPELASKATGMTGYYLFKVSGEDRPQPLGISPQALPAGPTHVSPAEPATALHLSGSVSFDHSKPWQSPPAM